MRILTGQRGRPRSIIKIFQPLVRFINTEPHYWARGWGLRLTPAERREVNQHREVYLRALRTPRRRFKPTAAQEIGRLREQAADNFRRLGAPREALRAIWADVVSTRYAVECEVVEAGLTAMERDAGKQILFQKSDIDRVVRMELARMDAYQRSKGDKDLSATEARERHEAVVSTVRALRTLGDYRYLGNEANRWAKNAGRDLARVHRWRKDPSNLAPPPLTEQQRWILRGGGAPALRLALGDMEWLLQAAYEWAIPLDVCDYCGVRVFIRGPGENRRKDCEVCQGIPATTRSRKRRARLERRGIERPFFGKTAPRK
jgi:hypothetical protein